MIRFLPVYGLFMALTRQSVLSSRYVYHPSHSCFFELIRNFVSSPARLLILPRDLRVSSSFTTREIGRLTSKSLRMFFSTKVTFFHPQHFTLLHRKGTPITYPDRTQKPSLSSSYSVIQTFSGGRIIPHHALGKVHSVWLLRPFTRRVQDARIRIRNMESQRRRRMNLRSGF